VERWQRGELKAFYKCTATQDGKKSSSTRRGTPEKRIAIDKSPEFARFVGVIKKK
jgi:hypothetical protein